jgi:archaellum component FlaG (FlaF/FlaG flagellin family)
MKKTIIAFVLCLLMIGCVTTSTLKFDPQALDGQETISKDGVEAVISQKKVRVTIQPAVGTYTSQDRPTIVVSVYGGEEAFNFSTEDIQVFVDGNPHGIIPYDELVKEIENREKRKINRLKIENDKRREGSGDSADLAYRVEQEYQSDVAAVKREARQSKKALDATMLKKTTVSPREECSGHVTMEKIPNPAQPHQVKVVVKAAGEEHEFLLNHLKVQ